MSRLRIFNDDAPGAPLLATSDRAEMAAELAKIDVDFEQWDASQPIAPGDPHDTILDAYRADIDRLVEANGFRTVEYERGTQMWRALVSHSKYTVWPKFGEAEAGHILLQDHGDRVSFRSIKIREIK